MALGYYQPKYEGGVVILKLPANPDKAKALNAQRRAREIADEKSDPFAHGWRPYRGGNTSRASRTSNNAYKRSNFYRAGRAPETRSLL